jgi:uncharacterized protein with NRDE domain
MCLAVLALDESRRFPLVIAANRDEFFNRPAARLGWWNPAGDAPAILSGRDQKAGGTWMGLTAQGRMALVTNVRKPGAQDPNAPSRGELVPRWLRGDMRPDLYWPKVALTGYQPFNLIAADFRRGDCFYATSESACPTRLERGIFGLSNGSLDEPWPKVTRLKNKLRQSLDEAYDTESLARMLFEALSDKTIPADSKLPSTGVSIEVERMLSPAFIRSPDTSYGTRCSTLIITERVNKRLVTQVFERTFTAGPGLALLRRTEIKQWPPKYETDDAAEQVLSEIGPVADGDLADESGQPAKKRRVRSLLRPSHKL